ncbi:alginate O-acetyltransferase AlgX-related protein [Pigmentiphaga litoralis]|uniref:alginate O-acetyltransferase AlgX-related protein n=1 Tax=Pigmentiphaga litoralis TaxID=516702 RepID=UPI003B428065
MSPLAGVCFVLFLAGAAVSNAIGVIVNDVPITRQPVTLPAFLDGRVTKDIAGQLAEAPLPAIAARIERAASWLAIGDLGPRVREGCPGWLFLSDEMAVQTDGASNASARAQTVARVAHRLRSQDIDLMVAVVPDKSRIGERHLCGLLRAPELAGRVRQWVAQLNAAGVPAMDLTDAMEAPPTDTFLRTDTHWNEAGAQAAAAAVAARLLAWHDAPVRLGSRAQVTRTVASPLPRPGDLVRLAGIDGLPMAWQPPQDTVAESTFVVEADPAALDEAALFGDDALPTLALIGTSFSRTSNFVGYLQMGLQAQVANAARDGGEFAGAAAAYFASPAFTQTPPKLVVWEIPERSLQRPLAGEPALD